VLRFAFFAFMLISTSLSCLSQVPAQSKKSPAPAAAPQSLSEEVAAAEAAITQSDWKSAETKLGAWLTTHPEDARALFDAGYVADAQNRLGDAGGLYRRAVAANPQSFEAHAELGLLLARQGQTSEARAELLAATELDPGVAGTGAKARAWRALARIDQASDPAGASKELLEALKLSPETTEDTLLAANLADQAGQREAAEQAYRRVLAADPKSAPANAGLAHLLIEQKKYPEAEAFLRAALQLTPDDATLTAQAAWGLPQKRLDYPYAGPGTGPGWRRCRF